MTAMDAFVWSVPLPAVASERDLALLDTAESRRADRYRRTEDRASFVTGRAALRRVLAEHLKTEADRIVFGRHSCPGCGSDDHGPPRVVFPLTQLSFSFSRSEQQALVAVVPAGAVGADIEVLRPLDVQETAAQCLSPAETAYVRGLSPGEQLQAFYRAWVRKEAVTKAVGVGITMDLRTVDVSPDRKGPVTVRCGTGKGPRLWTVTDLEAQPGTMAALALPSTRRQPSIHARCLALLEG
ncbi:hypothetical protein GCM10010361_47090 [Streptomyces olivaceiscleroticus]|uniref:4'-phosphopantetheinyl transferase domain-containing protein n=2 Tax=Streptomyces olivaceiscleroticus TaxID=68245 RepID=A0ABN1AIB7_9ACTN